MQKRYRLLPVLLSEAANDVLKSAIDGAMKGATNSAMNSAMKAAMARLKITLAIVVLGFSTMAFNLHAAEFTFQFINNNERPINLKLFARGESQQEWPTKTKFYSLKPESAVQQLKISCEEGTQICWGAWIVEQTESGEIGASGKRNVRSGKLMFGAGERGTRSCPHCCHVCKVDASTPIIKLHDSGINAE